MLSLPSRERGLKSNVIGIVKSGVVAPFAGAWIEICAPFTFSTSFTSLPSRERGLKYAFDKDCVDFKASLPSRERGLKFRSLL